MPDYLQYLITLLFILNLAVTVFVAKRDDLTLFQKISQIAIVWVIPIIGAIGICMLNRDSDTQSIKGRRFYNHGKDDRGDSSHIDF